MEVYDILYKRGEQQGGKGIWLRCGVLLEKPDGKKSIKLDMTPTGNEWDGWLIVSRRDRDNNGQGGQVHHGDDVPF